MILFFTILTAYSLAYIFAHSFCAFLDRRVWKKPTVIEELKAIREEIAEARAMQDRTHMMFALHGVDDEANAVFIARINRLEWSVESLAWKTYSHDDTFRAVKADITILEKALKGGSGK